MSKVNLTCFHLRETLIEGIEDIITYNNANGSSSPSPVIQINGEAS